MPRGRVTPNFRMCCLATRFGSSAVYRIGKKKTPHGTQLSESWLTKTDALPNHTGNRSLKVLGRKKQGDSRRKRFVLVCVSAVKNATVFIAVTALATATISVS